MHAFILIIVFVIFTVFTWIILNRSSWLIDQYFNPKSPYFLNNFPPDRYKISVLCGLLGTLIFAIIYLLLDYTTDYKLIY